VCHCLHQGGVALPGSVNDRTGHELRQPKQRPWPRHTLIPRVAYTYTHKYTTVPLLDQHSRAWLPTGLVVHHTGLR